MKHLLVILTFFLPLVAQAENIFAVKLEWTSGARRSDLDLYFQNPRGEIVNYSKRESIWGLTHVRDDQGQSNQYSYELFNADADVMDCFATGEFKVFISHYSGDRVTSKITATMNGQTYGPWYFTTSAGDNLYAVYYGADRNRCNDEGKEKLAFNKFIDQSRVGDIILLGACGKDTYSSDPLSCSANVIQEETGGWISGVGYGVYQHAALIYGKNLRENSLDLLQARGPSGGVGVDKMAKIFHPYTTAMLLRVKNFSDSDAQWVATNAYNRWNNTSYDTFLEPWDNEMYCAELVWDAYNQHGVALNDNSYYPYGLITPDNFLQSSKTEPVLSWIEWY